jgi:hypothetical protein
MISASSPAVMVKSGFADGGDVDSDRNPFGRGYGAETIA